MYKLFLAYILIEKLFNVNLKRVSSPVSDVCVPLKDLSLHLNWKITVLLIYQDYAINCRRCLYYYLT